MIWTRSTKEFLNVVLLFPFGRARVITLRCNNAEQNKVDSYSLIDKAGLNIRCFIIICVSVKFATLYYICVQLTIQY